MVENGERKGGRLGTNGLCVVTKTNAWKTIRCESVERRRGGLSDHFLVEIIIGWLEECREDGGCEKSVEGE